jgi:Terminase large subunit, ATPase domain
MDVRAYLEDPLAFYRREIVLDNGRLFGEVADPWQLDLLAEIESGRHRFAWIETPRGFWKTGMLAAVATKRLLLGRPGQRIFSAAGKKDQARILADAVGSYFRRNPRIAEGVGIGRYETKLPARDSIYEALSADAPTSWGLKPSTVLIDELTQWSDRELFDSLLSATGKMEGAQLLVICNAGLPGTWQADLRAAVREDPDWYFYAARPGQASWITQKWIESQRRMLPPSVFARMIENRWVTGEGEFVTESQVNAVTDPTMAEVTAGPVRDGCRRYVGLDLGLTRDMASTAVVHVELGGRIVLDRLRTWKGSRENPVKYADIEDELDFIRAIFGGATILADQWNIQKLMQDRPDLNIEPTAFGPKFYSDLSATLFRVIANAKIALYPDAGEVWVKDVRHTLQSQLVGLQVLQGEFGFRFDHRTGGFSDMAVALALAVYRAVKDVGLHFDPSGFRSVGRRHRAEELEEALSPGSRRGFSGLRRDFDFGGGDYPFMPGGGQ